MFAWQLRGDDHETWEARDCAEAVALYKNRPAALLVLDGYMPEDDIIRAVADVRLFEGEHSLPLVPVLGLALDAEQGERLRRVGCEYLLYHPLGRQELRDMARALLAGESPAPQSPPPATSIKNCTVRPALQAKSGTEVSTPSASTPAASPAAGSSGISKALSADALSSAQANTQTDTPVVHLKDSKETPAGMSQPAVADMPSTAWGDAPGDTSEECTASSIKNKNRPPKTQPAQRPAQGTASKSARGQTASSVPFRSPQKNSPAGDAADVGPLPPEKAAAQTAQRSKQTPHAASLPLAAPLPRKAGGWLSSFFKPKPQLTPQNSSALTLSSEGQDEWVGDPVPVRAVPDADEKKTTPDVSSVASPEAAQILSLQPDSGLSFGKEETQSPPMDALALDIPESTVQRQKILPEMQSRPLREVAPSLDMHLGSPGPEDNAPENSGTARPKTASVNATTKSGRTEDVAGQDEMGQEAQEPLEAMPLSNVEAMPFLSMLPGGGAVPRDDNDEIVNLTEGDMVLPGPLMAVERRFAENSDTLFTKKQDAGGKLALELTEPAADARPADLASIRKDVRESLTRGDAVLLTRAAARLRDCAEHFGLHTLADLAYLLEESAHAEDFEAVRLIMPDLDLAVDRELARVAEQEV